MSRSAGSPTVSRPASAGQALHELVVHRVHHDRPRAGAALLARQPERRAGHALRSLVQVRRGSDDRRVLAAHLGERRSGVGTLLEGARDPPAHLGRARERHAVHGGLHERAAGGGTALNHVEHARREPRRAGDLPEDRARPGRLLRGLEHHRVAGDQRRARHVDGERRGEVERRDHGEHAVGPKNVGVALALHEAVERPHVALVVLHQVGVGGDQVHRLLHLEDRLRPRLARLEAHHRGELEVALADPRGHRPHALAALRVGACCASPRRPPGRVHRARDQRRRRVVRAAGHLAVTGGVEALERLARASARRHRPDAAAAPRRRPARPPAAPRTPRRSSRAQSAARVGEAGAHRTAWQAGSLSGSSPRHRSSMPMRGRLPRLDQRAARVEAAAGRDARRVGRLAGEDLLVHLLDLGHHRQQRARVRVARLAQDLLRRALLHDPAQVHDGHAVGHVPGEPEVVGHHEDPHVGLAHELQHQRQDLPADRGVEARHRLVGHEQARVQDHRPGDDHALALAARDLVRVAGEELLGRPQARAREPLGHELLLVAGQLLDAHALGHGLVDRLPGVQRTRGVLEDHLRGAPVLAQRAAVVAERLAANADLAGERPLQPHDRARERGLAAAGLADQGHDLAAVHGEVHAVHRARHAVAALELDLEAAHLEQGAVRCRPMPSALTPAPGRRGRGCRQRRGRAGGPQLDRNRRAHLDRRRAARVERAAGRQVARVGRVAGEPGRRHPERLVADHREGARERARVRVGGRGEHLAARPLLDHAPRVHHGQPLAHRGERREVVRDEDGRQPEALLEVLEQPQHLRLDHHVERGGGLVGDQEARLACQRRAR